MQIEVCFRHFKIQCSIYETKHEKNTDVKILNSDFLVSFMYSFEIGEYHINNCESAAFAVSERRSLYERLSVRKGEGAIHNWSKEATAPVLELEGFYKQAIHGLGQMEEFLNFRPLHVFQTARWLSDMNDAGRSLTPGEFEMFEDLGRDAMKTSMAILTNAHAALARGGEAGVATASPWAPSAVVQEVIAAFTASTYGGMGHATEVRVDFKNSHLFKHEIRPQFDHLSTLQARKNPKLHDSLSPQQPDGAGARGTHDVIQPAAPTADEMMRLFNEAYRMAGGQSQIDLRSGKSWNNTRRAACRSHSLLL
jgi:hypothetical protein